MIRKEIFEYVKRELSDGYTADQVEEALVDQGWAQGDAEDTIAAVQEGDGETAKGSVDMENSEYVGFWKRVAACCLDLIILGIPSTILSYALIFINMRNLVYLVSLGFAVLFIYFEVSKGGTPGKLILGYRIVTEDGDYMTIPEALLRYVGRILASIPLCLGYFWIGWDDEKQGWHDKIAKTHVVKV